MFVNGSNHPYGCIQQCQVKDIGITHHKLVLYFNINSILLGSFTIIPTIYYERVTFLFKYSDLFVLQSTIRISTQ